MKYQPKRILGLAIIVIAAHAAWATRASAQLQATPLHVSNIKGNVYWAEGGAGVNTGIIVGTTGVIVVDSKTTDESSKEVLGEIAKITPKQVDTIIITHSDHIKGIEVLPPNLTIIAHENTKKEMEASKARDAAPADRMPNKTVGNDQTMTIDGVRVRLLHWAPAHTSGDLAVYFPDQKVVFAGDLLVTDRPPDDTPIHVELNGTATGWFESVKGLLKLDADVFVLGHGEKLFTRDDVKKKLATLQAKWDKIKAMADQGKSLNDVKTAMGESTTPKPTAQGNEPAPTLTEIMYSEMTKKS